MTDPTARLLTRTRRRLFAFTLGLVALLVVGIGVASAFVTLRALDAAVDEALTSSVTAAAATLHDSLPSGEESSGEEGRLAASDTFILLLDGGGSLVANPSRVSLRGIPDQSAVALAATSGRDLRTVDAGDFRVRLLTVRIAAEEGGGPTGFVQGGFRLTLHDEQSRTIVLAIVLVGLSGLFGAAIVTLVVTGRALVPVRRSFETQRRFVADASHELRTPAALIRANADVLERESLVAEGGRSLVADIVTEADRLARLVGDLLQLAASESTGLVLDTAPVDLAAVAADTVRQARALATERGVRLELGAPAAGAVLATGDRDRLIQLVLILLDNAFDHSPPGGTVTVDVGRSGPNAVLTVVDEGPGIPVAQRERVFEPFTRLPGVRRDRAGGTGLGLAIARRIVRAHGGQIRVADAPGGGAALIVTIPAPVVTAAV